MTKYFLGESKFLVFPHRGIVKQLLSRIFFEKVWERISVQRGKNRNSLSSKKYFVKSILSTSFGTFFSKNVALTKFLSKKCKREIPLFPHCAYPHCWLEKREIQCLSCIWTLHLLLWNEIAICSKNCTNGSIDFLPSHWWYRFL